MHEALDRLREGREWGNPWTLIAGGTDLYVPLNAGTLPDRRFLDLWRLNELRGQRESGGGLRLGALETFTDLRHSLPVRRRFPALTAAAGVVGGWQIQNRATLGGNIANGSPAGDSLPVLLALDARVRLVSGAGAREVDFQDFHTGYRSNARRSDELLESVWIPYPARGTRQHFRKVGTRLAQAISKVVLATSVRVVRGRVAHVRIALGSVAATVVRIREAEDALMGEKLAGKAITESARRLREVLAPIDDIRSTREYRLEVAGRLLSLALHEAAR